jgi:hypothetical protein
VAASADGLLIAGGKLTNGAGHAGKFRRLTQLMFSHDIIMNDDGSYTTDNTPLGWISMDEAGRQRKHHEKPDHISYTDEAGIQGVEEAPFGKTIEFLVNHKVLMKPGKQYGARDASAGTVLNPRPDTRNKAVQLIQESRVETRDAKLRVA